ncbi:MAG: gliding motility-associated C-terminal domain-containing protein [Bacteroidota bacterium]
MNYLSKIFFLASICIPLSLQGQGVVINEVLSSPPTNPADLGGTNGTTDANSFYNTDFPIPYNREWVELYNPSGCDSADISCYTLACNMDPNDLTTHNWGAFTFPVGTTIPPHGYIVIGGNDAQVPFLDFNLTQYRQNSYGVNNLDGDLTRWFLRDEFGWVAIYDPSGNPVDALYWNLLNDPSLLFTESEYLFSMSTHTSCNGLMTLAAAVNIPGIEFVGAPIQQTNVSFQRIQDGSMVWCSAPQTPTPRANNFGAVSPPTLTLTTQDDYCNLGIGSIHFNVQYHGTDSLHFHWNTSPADTLSYLNHLHSGTYILSIFDPYYCSYQTDTVIISSQPPFSISFNNVTPQSCSDTNGSAMSVINNGHPPYTYSWNSTPVQTSNVLQQVAAGQYILTVSDSLGCVVSDTVLIQDTYPFPPISLNLRNDTCNRGVGAAFAVNNTSIALNYSWSNASTNASINGLHAGSYSLTVSNPQCSNTYFFDIVNAYEAYADFIPSPAVMFTDNPLCEFFDNSINPISWQWNFGDGSSDFTQHPVHAYAATGSYLVTLVIEDSHACFDSISKTLIVKDNTVFYIPNAFTPNEDGKNEVFKVSGLNIYDFDLRIYTRWGEQIFVSYDAETGWDGKFQGKDCPQGVYVWRFQYSKDKERGGGKKEILTGNVTLIR